MWCTAAIIHCPCAVGDTPSGKAGSSATWAICWVLCLLSKIWFTVLPITDFPCVVGVMKLSKKISATCVRHTDDRYFAISQLWENESWWNQHEGCTAWINLLTKLNKFIASNIYFVEMSQTKHTRIIYVNFVRCSNHSFPQCGRGHILLQSGNLLCNSHCSTFIVKGTYLVYDLL